MCPQALQLKRKTINIIRRCTFFLFLFFEMREEKIKKNKINARKVIKTKIIFTSYKLVNGHKTISAHSKTGNYLIFMVCFMIYLSANMWWIYVNSFFFLFCFLLFFGRVNKKKNERDLSLWNPQKNKIIIIIIKYQHVTCTTNDCEHEQQQQ